MLSAGFIARTGGTRRRISGQALTPRGWRSFSYNQPFRVASVSKMVTARGFMALVADGRADLDADVSAYLGRRLRHPNWPELAITPRMLLSHTSGLRNGDDFPVPFNEPLLTRLETAASAAPGTEALSLPGAWDGWFSSPLEPPGAWFGYSDVNFGIVAQIIECITAERFDHFMHRVVFAPLRLEIGYNWSGVPQRRRLRAAAACRWIDQAWQAQADAAPPPAPQPALYRRSSDASAGDADYRVGENGLAFAPHGGLRLSLNDMDRLAQFFAHDAIAATMCSPVWRRNTAGPNGNDEFGFFESYGLGVHAPGAGVRDQFLGNDSAAWRGHFGDAYGWMTGLFWNVRTKDTLVYAINGMPEAGREPAANSALTTTEQSLIDNALRSTAGT